MARDPDTPVDAESDKVWRDAAALCGNSMAHALLIRDALDQQSLPALVAAVRAIARARGLSRLAGDAGVSTRALTNALNDGGGNDVELLRYAATRLAARWHGKADSRSSDRIRENDKN